MKSKFKRIVFILLIISSFIISSCGKNSYKIKIMFTNDIQGAYIAKNVLYRSIKKKSGGFALLADLVKEYKKRAMKKGELFLLLDAGDFFQGTPEGDFYKGSLAIELMNKIGYDALTLGNHDFDFGVGNVLKLARQSEFPLLSANVYAADTKRFKLIKPYIIKQYRDMKIGIIGVTTPFIEGLKPRFPVPVVKKYIGLLKKSNVDLIIAVSHLGFIPGFETKISDRKLAYAVPEIDIILGGHTELDFRQPVILPDSETIICQTSGHLLKAGYLEINYSKKNKKIVNFKHKLIPLNRETKTEDKEIKSIIRDHILKEYDEIIGAAGENLFRSRLNQAKLGTLITDLIKNYTGADCSILKNTAIRDNILKGEVTKRDIKNAVPFDNKLATTELSGKELENLLKILLETRYNQYNFSGIKITKSISDKALFRNIKINDKSLNPDKSYLICLTDYRADKLKKRKSIKDYKTIDMRLTLLVERHFKNNSPVIVPDFENPIVFE